MDFDGVNRVIKLSSGIRSVDTIDLYSSWKRWVSGGEAEYAPAFRTVGGDPLTGSLRSPVYYFLINGWKVEPASESHTLDVQTNLYAEGGEDPFQTPTGNYSIRVNNKVSDAQIVTVTTGSGLSNEQAEDLKSIYLSLLGERRQNIPSGVVTVHNDDGSVKHTIQAYKDGDLSSLIDADQLKPV